MRPLGFLRAPCPWARTSPRSINHSSLTYRLYSQKSESDDPLRILFCGTDSFSTESLKALHAYSTTSKSNIISIDVVTKSDKRVGRGRSQFRAPPIKTAATELGLALHQIDTFTGWQPPAFGREHCNLIVAVSFGLLIPPRVLGNAKYGGLNVHPSMLPDLRGPAPIPWTINLGRRTTGLTLQTLHPSRFDEGQILDQTPQPGLHIPDPDDITHIELKTYLAPIGAKMLVNAIRNKLYIPPYGPAQPDPHTSNLGLVHAPKITKEFQAVDFQTMTATEILRRNRATWNLHTFARAATEPTKTRRFIFGWDTRPLKDEDIPDSAFAAANAISDGVPYAIIPSDEKLSQSHQPLIVNAKKDSTGGIRQIVIPQIIVASMATGPAVRRAASARFFLEPEFHGRFKLYRFAYPLSAHPSPSEKSPSDPKPTTM